MSSKIYINEDIGYVEAWEALAHLTDDWICGGNVSHETIMNMRDVIDELRNELAEYVELHSTVASQLNTSNQKLLHIVDIANSDVTVKKSGLTPRVPDSPYFCLHCGAHISSKHLPWCKSLAQNGGR